MVRAWTYMLEVLQCWLKIFEVSINNTKNPQRKKCSYEKSAIEVDLKKIKFAAEFYMHKIMLQNFYIQFFKYKRRKTSHISKSNTMTENPIFIFLLRYLF